MSAKSRFSLIPAFAYLVDQASLSYLASSLHSGVSGDSAIGVIGFDDDRIVLRELCRFFGLGLMGA